MSAIPKSFFPFLTELAEFSRNKLRVSTTANDSASPYDVTIIQLPEGKLQLDTFSVGGLLTTTTTTGKAVVGCAEHLIDQIYVELGGICVMPAMTFYNQIFQIHADIQGVWNKKGLRQMLQLQKVEGGDPAANLTNAPFQLNQFIGFLKDIKILLTDRMPPVRIYIKWASPAVLACSATTTDATYSIKKLWATVDLLGLSPVYDQLITDKVAHAPLEIPFTNFTSVAGATSGVSGSSTRWSTSANCVERVMGTLLSPTYNTLNAKVDPVTFSSPYFTRGGIADLDTPGLTSRFTINGVSYPNIPMDSKRGEIVLDTMQAMNEDHDMSTAQHPSMSNLANFHNNFFVHAHSFTYNDDESANRLCGLSGGGNQLLGTYETVSTTGSNVMPLVLIQHRSILEIGQNRNVRYIH